MTTIKESFAPLKPKKTTKIGPPKCMSSLLIGCMKIYGLKIVCHHFRPGLIWAQSFFFFFFFPSEIIHDPKIVCNYLILDNRLMEGKGGSTGMMHLWWVCISLLWV
jgi:hypothetical protein